MIYSIDDKHPMRHVVCSEVRNYKAVAHEAVRKVKLIRDIKRISRSSRDASTSESPCGDC